MSKQLHPVIIIQGAQFGSEAKGAIAAYLCIERNIDYTVRTGAINAGHTVVYGGKRYAMQQLPCGWVNPSTQLVIGAGAYIHPPTLFREIDAINAAMPGSDVRSRLWVDSRCGTHTEDAEALSKAANRHHRMGATGKGCSEAIVAKIRNRNDGYQLFADTAAGKAFEHDGGPFVDTVKLLNTQIDDGAGVLIEGTQGTLLDLHLGPYPFTTSRMTSAANWIAESGLSPALDYEVVLVCRTFPIRVAGNSGPLDNEIEWTDLATEINLKLSDAGLPSKVSAVALYEFQSKLHGAAHNAIMSQRYRVPRLDQGGYNLRLSTWTQKERNLYRVAASELHRDALELCSTETVAELGKLFEMTTVTKKLRRIARLSVKDLQYAVAINRPAWIALTFMDYEEPGLATGTEVVPAVLSRTHEYIEALQTKLGVSIRLISAGPGPGQILDVSGG